MRPDGIDIITSRKNERVKAWRALKERSERERTGLFLAEGVKCVREAVSSGFETEAILVTDPGLINDIGPIAAKVFEVSGSVLEAVSDAKTPQGVIAVVRRKDFEPAMSGLTVVMDDVSDPGNVGSVIRSADAAGASCVVLTEGCADAFGPKAVRASMGSIFHLPVLTVDARGYLRTFAETGAVVCGHLEGTDAFPAAENICVVIGNESRGVGKDIADLCGFRYRIPIYGQAESLNAGVAAGIMLYRAAESIRSFDK